MSHETDTGIEDPTRQIRLCAQVYDFLPATYGNPPSVIGCSSFHLAHFPPMSNAEEAKDREFISALREFLRGSLGVKRKHALELRQFSGRWLCTKVTAD
jgi:hypothetical protein